MSPKKQFTHLKETRKLAKFRKIEVKSEILVEDTFFLFEDESTKGSWMPENNTSCHKDYDWEEDDESTDDMEMTDDDKDVLDMDLFTKLFKVTQDLSRFKNHQTLFLNGPHLFKQQKRRHTQYQRKLVSSAHGC